MNISFDKKQAHGLALIWAKSEWERKSKYNTKEFYNEVDEYARMDELFNIYKDAFDHYSYFFDPKESET